MMILKADGSELIRSEKFIGEVPFREQFLAGKNPD
jgi:hypothetical protein